MRAEQRRLHADAAQLAEPARRPELFQLVRRCQPVTRFDFDRGDALGQQRVQARQRRGHEPVFARRPRRAHGRADAAAGARNFFISCPPEPLLEFIGTVAAEHEVRVAIDRDPA